MKEEELTQILERISKASTAQELADIRHESPGWELMTEQMCTKFSQAIEARRKFLKEVSRVCSEEMSPYDRAQYISLKVKSSEPYAQELLQIAREVQERVTKNMTTREIYRFPDLIDRYENKQEATQHKKYLQPSKLKI